MISNETKSSQRLFAQKNRTILSKSSKEAFSIAISERLLLIPEVKAAKYILSYMATEDEASLSYFAKLCKDKKIAYPVSYAKGIMEAYIPGSDNAFVTGKYGIISPKEDESTFVSPQQLDVVLVPCVAFASNCKRLGHGAGYYDRYLSKCTKAKFICIAFEAQKLEDIVTDQHDVPMDMVVTESATYWSE